MSKIALYLISYENEKNSKSGKFRDLFTPFLYFYGNFFLSNLWLLSFSVLSIWIVICVYNSFISILFFLSQTVLKCAYKNISIMKMINNFWNKITFFTRNLVKLLGFLFKLCLFGLLFQWASTIKIQLSLLVYKAELIISLKINLFSPWHSWIGVKSLVWPNRGSNQRSNALEASTLTIMPPMRLQCNKKKHDSKWRNLHIYIPVYSSIKWLSMNVNLRARLECVRSLVRAPIGSNQRLKLVCVASPLSTQH
jgi:hypothetical protein